MQPPSQNPMLGFFIYIYFRESIKKIPEVHRGICTAFNIPCMLMPLSYSQIWIWNLLEARASGLRKRKRSLLNIGNIRQCEGQERLKIVSRKLIPSLWRSRTVHAWVRAGTQEIFHNFLFLFPCSGYLIIIVLKMPDCVAVLSDYLVQF